MRQHRKNITHIENTGERQCYLGYQGVSEKVSVLRQKKEEEENDANGFFINLIMIIYIIII